MFGDRPALTPAELTYQRLLARDPVEAAEQARAYLQDKPLVSYYEDIFIPTLKLAHGDVETGRLDDERLEHVRDAAGELIEDLADHQDRAASAAETETDGEEKPLAHLTKVETSPEMLEEAVPEAWRSGKPVLCVPGIGELDEVLAVAVAQLVERRGIGARAEEAEALSMSRIFSLDTKEAKLICLCYIETVTPAQIRYSVRRLRRKAPEAHILVGLMGEAQEMDDAAPNVSYAKGSLAETVDAVFTVAANASAGEEEAQPETETSGNDQAPRLAGQH
jgi:hypothetical protein